MIVVIGSARIDEHGNLAGGKAGDQTGKEVSAQNYYNHSKGWIGLRPKMSEIADKQVQAMKDACANNNIGYDQNQRLGVVDNLLKAGSIRNITTKTEADCSSLVRAVVIEATGIDPGNFTTSNEVSKLMATGLYDKVEINGEKDCRKGDILVTKRKGHTAIVISVDEPAKSIKRPKKIVTVTAWSLYIRKGPDKEKYAAIGTYSKGNRVEILEEKNGWGKTEKGWISLKWTK